MQWMMDYMKSKTKIITIVLIASFLFPMFIGLSIQIPISNDVKFIDVDQTLDFEGGTGIQSSSANIIPSNISTYYDIHYRMVQYGKVLSYNNDMPSVDQINGQIGISRFYNQTTKFVYRAQALSNGTIYVYNLTNVIPAKGMVDEIDAYKGINMTFIKRWNVNTASFQPQKLLEERGTGGEELIYLAGKNTTNNKIVIFVLDFDAITKTFSYKKNITIQNPSFLASINDVKIYSAISDGGYQIGGKYLNGTVSVPFAFYGDFSTGNIIVDFMNLTTSTTDWKYCGNVIFDVEYSILGFSGYYFYVISDKYVLWFGISKFTARFNIPQIPYSNPIWIQFGNIAHLVSPWSDYEETITWNYYIGVTGELGSFTGIAKYAGYPSSPPYDLIITRREIPAFVTQILERDTLMNAFTDINDGIFVYGEDTQEEVWQTWIVGSGSKASFFDLYIPLKILTYPRGGTGTPIVKAFELWYTDSRAMWYMYFNSNDTGVIDIGKSKVTRVVSQRADISHKRGTGTFQYTVSGYLERSTNDLVELNIIPLYIQPGSIGSLDPAMLSTKNIHVFLNGDNGGILLRPKTIFSGFGSRMTEFQVTFDADFCPIVFTSMNVSLLAMNVYYVIVERYSNGTSTQKLCRTFSNAKSLFVTYSFDLETSISIQDSHMLDELHFYMNGLEYSPYSVSFTTTNSSVLVTDKITNDTLYNGYAIFMDPLPLPIPAKYEFFIRYFSNFDRFGFDFSILNTFLNGTQLATDSARILSPNAEIVVTDFSGSVVKNITINKELNGTYVNIGLDVVSTIFMNRYNFTINLYLKRASTSIYYQLPAGAAISLRLALGNYSYRVTTINGTELIDETFTLEASFGVTIGSTVFTFGEPSPLFAGLTLDSIIGIALITFMLIVTLLIFATLISRARTKSPQTSVFSSKPKPKANRPNGGYLKI